MTEENPVRSARRAAVRLGTAVATSVSESVVQTLSKYPAIRTNTAHLTLRYSTSAKVQTLQSKLW